jgi:hypothetical protein
MKGAKFAKMKMNMDVNSEHAPGVKIGAAIIREIRQPRRSLRAKAGAICGKNSVIPGPYRVIPSYYELFRVQKADSGRSRPSRPSRPLREYRLSIKVNQT